MADDTKRDWRELCAAVTNESDSTKLRSLIQELIDALDEGERSWRHSIRQPDAQLNKRSKKVKTSIRGFMSKADVPSVQPKNALTLADELIRKLDEESNKKLEKVNAEEKSQAGRGLKTNAERR